MKKYKNYIEFVAKTDKSNTELWLPLWMHLRDTVGAMEKIIDKWIPESVIKATKLNKNEFEKVAIFFAYTHDIGKVNSYFQSIITKQIIEKRIALEEKGFIINDIYMDQGKTPHAYVGEEILKHIIEKKCNTIEEKNKLNAYASVIGAHHGKPQNPVIINGQIKVDYFEDYRINLFGRDDEKECNRWENIWEAIIDDALELCSINSFFELPNIDIQAQTIFSGLLVMADWMASNQFYFKLIGLGDNFDIEKYPERISYAWNKLEFPERWETEICKMDKITFEERFGFMPNEVQELFINIVNNVKNPGLFILEAQMGVGKTEAALAAAEVLANDCESGGVFFGLPTQATSNALFYRLMEWAKNVSEDTLNSIRLAHGTADLNEEYNKYKFNGESNVNEDEMNSGIEVHPWFQGNKKALLADFVVGTIDQFLLATLKRKHFMLRHLGLIGKVVIIDECHAYDAYMNEYLLDSLRWMGAYGVPVIMLSATLPKERRKEFILAYAKQYTKCILKRKQKDIICNNENWKESDEYPLFTWTDGNTINQKGLSISSLKEKKINVTYSSEIESVLKMIKTRTRCGGCACIITNTVRDAQKMYYFAKEKMNDYNIILYHAQFVMPDRVRKEKELLEKMGKDSTDVIRNHTILIGTQVLEQSLDYDADILVTQLCPMDLLLQRIGRLHRHIRDGSNSKKTRPIDLNQPEVVILLDGEEKPYNYATEKIYGNFLLSRTLKQLERVSNEINIPRDILYMVQNVYDIKSDFSDKEEYIEEYNNTISRKKQLAQVYALNKPSYSLKRNMDGMLDVQNELEDAEAAVRDGELSIDVILLKKVSNVFVTCVGEEDCVFDSRIKPSESDAKKISKQKIRLPIIFSLPGESSKIINELEKNTLAELSSWQESPWLAGELFLILNEDAKAELGKYEVKYSFEEGFVYSKKESEV